MVVAFFKVQNVGNDFNVDVPVDEGFFTNTLGTTLLKNQNKISTVAALSNTRLVAIYFSAHWCGPCRNFTPVSIKLYYLQILGMSISK